MEEMIERIRKLRGTMGLTQGEFAAKMGVKQNTWSNIETGVNPCSDRYVNLLCLTFNARKSWILSGQGEMFEPKPQNPQHDSVIWGNGKSLHPEVAELISIYQELVPLNQKAVLDFLETTLQSQRNTIKSLEHDKGIE